MQDNVLELKILMFAIIQLVVIFFYVTPDILKCYANIKWIIKPKNPFLLHHFIDGEEGTEVPYPLQ